MFFKTAPTPPEKPLHLRSRSWSCFWKSRSTAKHALSWRQQHMVHFFFSARFSGQGWRTGSSTWTRWVQGDCAGAPSCITQTNSTSQTDGLGRKQDSDFGNNWLGSCVEMRVLFLDKRGCRLRSGPKWQQISMKIFKTWCTVATSVFVVIKPAKKRATRLYSYCYQYWIIRTHILSL